jgi:hypothetical protein
LTTTGLARPRIVGNEQDQVPVRSAGFATAAVAERTRSAARSSSPCAGATIEDDADREQYLDLCVSPRIVGRL